MWDSWTTLHLMSFIASFNFNFHHLRRFRKKATIKIFASFQQPHKHLRFSVSVLTSKVFLHFVREWSICDGLYPSHRTFASVKPRQARLHSPKQRQYRNYSWLHRETATKIVCISPTSKIAPTILFPVDKLWFDGLLWQPLRNNKICFIWSWNGDKYDE